MKIGEIIQELKDSLIGNIEINPKGFEVGKWYENLNSNTHYFIYVYRIKKKQVYALYKHKNVDRGLETGFVDFNTINKDYIIYNLKEEDIDILTKHYIINNNQFLHGNILVNL